MMFGRKPNPYGMPDYMAGAGMPGMDPAQMGIDPSLPEDPYAATRPAKPGFFAKGGAWRDVLGEGLGAVAQQFGGSNPYEQQRSRQHEEALIRLRGEQDAASDQRRIDAQNDSVDIFGNGDDGFFSFSKSGGVNPLVPGSGPKEDSVLARLRAAGIDPNSEQGRQAIMMSMPGYGYSPEVFGRRQQLKGTTPGKAPGAAGGGGVTPTARAKAIAEAEAAISRGADPAAVRARLAKMGIR